MVIRARKILQENMKGKKKHVIVMFIYINEVNTYAIQRVNACAKQQLYSSVRWKIL